MIMNKDDRNALCAFFDFNNDYSANYYMNSSFITTSLVKDVNYMGIGRQGKYLE